MLNQKDIIAINMEFDNGKVSNQSSLSYAVEYAKGSRNWLKSAAHLVRAILIDHVFEDGNKRTAAAIIVAYIEMNGFEADPEKTGKAIIEILKKNITSIDKIMRLIENAIK